MTEAHPTSQFPSAAAAFIDATEPFRPAMVPSFSFIAFRRNGRWEIFRARYALNLPLISLQELSIRTANVLAGFRLVQQDGLSLREYIEVMLSGQIEIDGEILYFQPSLGGNYATNFVPLHADGIANQNRTAVLQIYGHEERGYLSHPPLDWELRAGSQPYESVADLVNALGLPLAPSNGTLFEAIAFSFIAVENGSHVAGTSANFRLRLCKGLEPEKAHIGYRVLSSAAAPLRGQIEGTSLSWTEQDGVMLGEVSRDVPPAAIVHAFACYEGVAYQHWWFNDPSHTQNPRRAAYEASDEGLEKLQTYLRNEGKQARDLEAAISWLLWMLGFNPIHLGALPRMSDAADVLVTTPQGHFAVIECTTGLLKAEHKLTNLINRTVAVRAKLAQSNYPQVRVLPVILTTKTREEVRADLVQAEQLGVIVIAQDDVPELVARTLLVPNPDALFAEAEQSLQAATALGPEPELPLT